MAARKLQGWPRANLFNARRMSEQPRLCGKEEPEPDSDDGGAADTADMHSRISKVNTNLKIKKYTLLWSRVCLRSAAGWHPQVDVEVTWPTNSNSQHRIWFLF